MLLQRKQHFGSKTLLGADDNKAHPHQRDRPFRVPVHRLRAPSRNRSALVLVLLLAVVAGLHRYRRRVTIWFDEQFAYVVMRKHFVYIQEQLKHKLTRSETTLHSAKYCSIKWNAKNCCKLS